MTTRRILLVALLAAAVVAAPTAALFMIAAREQPAPSDVGRYQALRDELGLVLVDTTTGQAYRPTADGWWNETTSSVALSATVLSARAAKEAGKQPPAR